MDASTSNFDFFDYSSDSGSSQTDDTKINDKSETVTTDTDDIGKEGNVSSSRPGDLPSLEENSEEESPSDAETLEVLLSVYWKRGKLGAATYSSADCQVRLLNDVVDVHPEFNNLKALVAQITPSRVITCGGLSDSFVQVLTDTVNGSADSDCEIRSETNEDSTKKIFFMSTRRKDLNYDSCKRHILGLRFGFEPEDLSEEDHGIFVNSHIDLNQEAMIVSFGMLVKYLEKYLPQINLSHEPVRITFVTHISLRHLVSMNDNTYRSLQIFNPRVHPSAFKRNAVDLGTREGLSLFAIFNRCRSRAGVKRMREIFMNPSKNLDEINERLDAVDYCVKPQHQHIVQNLLDCVKRVESVTVILANLYRTRVKISHWRSLYKSLYNAILIGDICEKQVKHVKLFDKVAKSITHNVHEVTHYMNQVIDFDESTTKNHFTVRNGIDSKLDLLRQTYGQIPDVLVKVAELELEDLPTFIEQCSIIYITELGYLLSVPVWKGEGIDVSEYTLPNFDVKFIVNNYVHYKTPRCVELDSVLGDTVASISDIESKIMVTLIQFIHVRMADIFNAINMIAELDCVIAFATIASENNYRRPIVTSERKLTIVEGRHPLQELSVDSFVPNDTSFGTTDNFMKILTGPNASGKSVYLKQVALIAFLAHIGSFVPARSAEIGILDHIHSRIQTAESISTRISAFLIDLKQMSYVIYNSSPKSLVVIDEFGKGTTETDGLSLLAASLIHFLERGDKCPYTLVSTHFHSLPKLLPKTPLVKLQFMDYLIENDEIVYLHKIKDGVSGSSLTLLAAKTAGLPEETIKRCLEIQNRTIPLTCNPNLKITQMMLKEIRYMEKIFELVLSDDEDGTGDEGGGETTEGEDVEMEPA